MAAKVTFDPTTRLIKPNVSPDANGIISLNVQVDLYSDGKEDWLADPNLHKFRFPVQAIGGQVVSAGKLGTTYLLTDGWRVDPSLEQTPVIGFTQVSSVALFGGTGTNEAVRQGFQLVHPGYVREGHVTVRKVGDPTDDILVEIVDDVDTVYESVTIAGGALKATFEEETFFGSALETTTPSGTQLYFRFTRTGVRDITNYFEFALDNDVYALGEAEKQDSGAWSPTGGNDVVMRYRSAVPYQLQLEGNIFTDSGLPVALSVDNVNVQQTVSTLVELKELYEQALEDIRKVMLNSFLTDPATGKMIVYDDDGVTEAFSADIWEDVGKTQPYRGQGIERRDSLEPNEDSL